MEKRNIRMWDVAVGSAEADVKAAEAALRRRLGEARDEVRGEIFTIDSFIADAVTDVRRVQAGIRRARARAAVA